MMKLLKKHVEITYKHGEINTQIRLNPLESVAGIQVERHQLHLLLPAFKIGYFNYVVYFYIFTAILNIFTHISTHFHVYFYLFLPIFTYICTYLLLF